MSIYVTFSDKMYNMYLKKRFGINTCFGSSTDFRQLCNDISIADYMRNKISCGKKVYYTVNTSDKVQEGLYIAVEVGTSQANEWGIEIGDTSFTHPLLKDRNIQFFRNGILLTPFNKGEGSLYYSKEKSSDTLNFYFPLEEGEIIQINTI